MREIMPLTRAVVVKTHEASPDDPQENRKAIKSWHNRLYNGSIPRSVVIKLGRGLYLDLQAWEEWLEKRDHKPDSSKPGRPRTK
jgi:hypothetical protein